MLIYNRNDCLVTPAPHGVGTGSIVRFSFPPGITEIEDKDFELIKGDLFFAAGVLSVVSADGVPVKQEKITMPKSVNKLKPKIERSSFSRGSK